MMVHRSKQAVAIARMNGLIKPYVRKASSQKNGSFRSDGNFGKLLKQLKKTKASCLSLSSRLHAAAVVQKHSSKRRTPKEMTHFDIVSQFYEEIASKWLIAWVLVAHIPADNVTHRIVIAVLWLGAAATTVLAGFLQQC